MTARVSLGNCNRTYYNPSYARRSGFSANSLPNLTPAIHPRGFPEIVPQARNPCPWLLCRTTSGTQQKCGFPSLWRYRSLLANLCIEFYAQISPYYQQVAGPSLRGPDSQLNSRRRQIAEMCISRVTQYSAHRV